MENILLVRYSEIHLKGLNRPMFERMLSNNIKKALRGLRFKLVRDQGRIFINEIEGCEIDEAADKVSKVFGVHSVSPAIAVEKDWDVIVRAALELMRNEALPGATFKVFSRRADKMFPKTSENICKDLGHELLQAFPDMTVDVHKPQIKFGIEIRDRAIMYVKEIKAVGGMPIGSAGRAMLLLSGGIDSPVAGYMISKRGVELSAVHFYSYPYTSERAKDKVVELAKLVAVYSGPIRLHIVPFTEIQLAIHEKCPEKETTILMRRLMMKISERIAVEDGALALVTGESLGQVASQTMEGLCVTDDAVHMPVFRPLIGFDKEEITDIAKKIDTFETSILPYEDCCTVFVPKHPVTKPVLEKLRESESMVDFTDMIEEAIKNTELKIVE